MSRLSKESPFCSEASASQEAIEEEATTFNRTLKVTLLSSEWKSTKGGVSTICRELAIQLAAHPNVEVTVYLPQCSDEDKRAADSHNVKLIEAEELAGYEELDWLASVPKNHAMDCIIGHGVTLGRQIQLIKRCNCYNNCKWIQIVHTTPEELGMFKTYADAISKGEKKHQQEVRLCERADQVVAVGPKLADAYSRSLRPCQKEVITLTPGIFTEFSKVKQATKERKDFFVLVFGRGDSEDFELKGYDIAAKAVAELSDGSYHLMFVGAPSGMEAEVKEKFLDCGISRAQLTVRCFDESRERLAKLLCEVDLVIMPSRTDGFGLTALEALSAGLPVLVSCNSGLGDAFKKVATGSNWIVASEEPKDWAKAISSVRQKDRDLRLEECEILREKYGAKYSWQKQCCSLVETMQKISFDYTKRCSQLHAEAGQTAVVTSHESNQSREPKNQRSKGNNIRRRPRRDGASSRCDKAVNTEYQEEVMPIPKGKGGDNLDQGSWKKLDFIPKEYMGDVIGKNRRNLNNIELNTGAIMKVSKENQTQSLYIKGSTEIQMRAIRKIKEIVNVVSQVKSGKGTVQHVHLDMTLLDLNHEFQLSSKPLTCHSGAVVFKVRPLEHPSQDMEDISRGLADVEDLGDKLLTVLNDIQKEKEEVIVDTWCHFGHAYITNVDEASQKEEYFTLEEIKEKLEKEKPDWTSIFKEGLENIQVEHIEENLDSLGAKEQLRYDFTFYTPSCRYVRVKVWLTEKDGGGQEEYETSSMAFSCSAPFSVMNVVSHVLPDAQYDSSNTPCFYICSQSQKRMKVDILMPSKQFDSQLCIKTYPVGHVPRTPQAEEEDTRLERYLMGMKIEDGQLTLPPVSERPDGFDLFYQRRSRRKIYEYEMDEEQFTLLVSRYQEKTLDAAETEGSDFEELDTETDIHLHCKEWDRMLEEGNWEPEQIVAKLPTFLQFMRSVQSSVAP